jgi:hydroxymethylpyrimidine pyrophosphatase-like HAD family hydrolase
MEANVIDSVDEAKNVSLIDVLPATAAKDSALQYLREKAGVSESRVVYAGDSGNDLAAFISGCKAIVVGNTTDSVKEQVRLRAPHPDRVFFAPGPCVEGVLQGCRHFGVFPAAET